MSGQIVVQVEKRSLAAKLAEVMAECHRIPKRGRNDFHKYDYATESDIVEVVRAELAKRSVMLIPAVVKQTREAVGEKGSVLTTLDMTFTFYDGDSGDTIERTWIGAGTDKEDKGAYKAMTGATKYFLLKTFLLATGDDPEQDEKPSRGKATAPAAAKPPASVNAKTGEIAESGDEFRIMSARVLTTGQKNGKPWVLHVITIDTGGKGTELTTFDEKIFAAAARCVDDGRHARVTWEKGPKFSNVTEFQPAVASREPGDDDEALLVEHQRLLRICREGAALGRRVPEPDDSRS